MNKRSTKTAAWLVLALALFLGFWSLLAMADRMAREGIGPECLLMAYEDSGSFEGVGQALLWDLDAWIENPDKEPDSRLIETTGASYYAAVGGRVLTNAPERTPEAYRAQPFFFLRETPSGSGEAYVETTFESLYSEGVSGTQVYFSIPESFVAGMQKDWTAQRDALTGQLWLLAGSLIAALAAIIALYWGAGRRRGEEGPALLTVDGWFTELFVLGSLGALAGAAAVLAVFLEWMLGGHFSALNRDGLLLAALAMALLTLAAVTLSMPLCRKAKAKTLVSGSLVGGLLGIAGRAMRGFFRGIRGFFDGSPYAASPAPRRIFRSQVTYICASAGLLFVCGFLAMVSYSFFFVLVFVVLELLVTAWHVLGTRRALEDVNAGLDQSRQAQVKSENIKTALITNVSHDLKTPLTSIISYVDLLAREEGLPETARDYVNVLAGKADRLNHMVSDLFDLSKSISGNIPLEMDVLDLRTLLEQTLADMKDKVDASGLTVKAALGAAPVPVYSDGKKLYRVFQNLIDNGLKYGLSGSRLYVDLSAGERMASVTIKNTAGYEMDFTPEEILQRFTRGDKARSGEGSGLGLSIAESFTQSCGGNFRVDIDGDQFKATITLPLQPEGGR